MTYPLEKEGNIYTKEEHFVERYCSNCKHREICEEWQWVTNQTLYRNKHGDTLFEAPNGTMGVYRCASYEQDLNDYQCEQKIKEKICEYEHLYCPACKSTKLHNLGADTLLRGLGTWHVVECQMCMQLFAVPCEC